MGVLLSRPHVSIPITIDINNLSAKMVESFLSFTCQTIPTLKPLLRAEQRYDDRFAYAYNSFSAYPLIRMRFRGKEAMVCPLPTLLFWRITGGLYYELLSDPRFAQAFGDSFQEFVGLVIERACPEKGLRLIAEQRYGTKKAPKASVDWIVSDDGSAMFVECKARRVSWNSKATSLDDLRPLGADIDNMANAVVQV